MIEHNVAHIFDLHGYTYVVDTINRFAESRVDRVGYAIDSRYRESFNRVYYVRSRKKTKNAFSPNVSKADMGISGFLLYYCWIIILSDKCCWSTNTKAVGRFLFVK